MLEIGAEITQLEQVVAQPMSRAFGQVGGSRNAADPGPNDND